jgi:2-oxoisovalerate dehydrogenase E1 component
MWADNRHPFIRTRGGVVKLEFDLEPRQVLAPDGRVVGDIPGLDDKELIELYRLMAISREMDRRALAAQRQGRFVIYTMLEGHEAAQVGSAFAMKPNDFVFNAYREHAVGLTRGLPLEVELKFWMGIPTDDWDVHGQRFGSITVPLASQIPHAVGYAYTTRSRGEDTVAVTYFGDGSTSETDFHSGLNFAGVWRTPNVFICENNQYAITVPLRKQTASQSIAQKALAYGIHGVVVDGMDVLAMYQATTEALERARNGLGPTLIEAVCYRYGAHATADDARRYRTAAEEAQWRERDPLRRYRAFLESRGLWTDEDEARVIDEAGERFDAAMETLEALPTPDRAELVRHTYARVPETLIRQIHDLEDAAGVERSEFAEDEIWRIGDEPKRPEGPTAQMNMAEAINATLRQMMDRDESIVVLGEDVGVAGGVFRITEGLRSDFGSDRVIDTPLNESGIVGTAVGMAIGGARPVAEIQFDGFVYPAFDQLVNHVGRFRHRTRSNVTLPMVVRWPNGAGIGAVEQHCDSPEGFFAHAPGHTVVIPSTAYDAKGLLTAALESEDPVLFIEPKVLYRAQREEVPLEHYTIPIGRARIAREGTDLTIVTYGGLVPKAMEAAQIAGDEGVSAEVIDLRTLFPWDEDTVAASVAKTGRLLIVQEPQRTSGIAAEIAAQIGERCGYELEAPIRRLTGVDVPWPVPALEPVALIGTAQIRRAIDWTMQG